MKITPKIGIDQLVFGMKTKDVEKIYGTPDKQFDDEEGNLIYLYNAQQLRLTFYEDEDFKMGYIICSNPSLTLFETAFLGKEISTVETLLQSKNFKALEVESFDSVDNFFNESNWMIFQVEFNRVIRFELGAVFNDKEDEFDWKFKG
ncbi:hypothetical protein [Flavobacterium sp.]|uniref:hypothetical protein n=1 Tax=Flavobacterium sp. TaxID=239 RepID=UPI003D128286